MGVEGQDEGCRVSYPSPRPPQGEAVPGTPPSKPSCAGWGGGRAGGTLAVFPALIRASEASSGSPGALPELFPSA